MKKFMALFAILASLATAWPLGASAGSQAHQAIAVQDIWARATATLAKVGGAYMTIRNSGNNADKLIGVASPVCAHAGLHQSLMENDIMKMRAVDAIEIPAGGMVMLKPGGYHIMLMGLTKPLKQGETFPITLTFEKFGDVNFVVKIMKPGAMGVMKMKHSN
ncbi:MAG: copper chaperone PCu(A)C [Alphaproteobacteria bacterium]